MDNQSDTLEELEGEDWGEPSHSSYLVRTIHALRRKPIREFTVEDLRITLGQRFGMEFLTPLALNQLEANPFAEGHFYPGDLLVSVMGLPREYWSAHPVEASRIAAIADRVQAELAVRDEIEPIKTEIMALLAQASWRAA
jgi:hypothetical protein